MKVKISSLVRNVPPDRLLIETDTPDQGPVKGVPNKLSNIGLVCANVATALDKTPAEIARLTTANAMRLYK